QIRGAHAGLDALGPLDIAPPAARRRLIEAGAESPASAGDHYGTDLGIGFGAVEGMVKFFQHGPGDRVERLGTVERDEHAAALLFVFDFFVVGHGNSLEDFGIMAWWSVGMVVSVPTHYSTTPLLHHSNLSFFTDIPSRIAA